MCIRDRPYSIELIWAQIKRQVANQNKTFKIIDVLHLANQALGSITGQGWDRCIHYVEKIMLDDFNTEVARDEVTEDFIIKSGKQ